MEPTSDIAADRLVNLVIDTNQLHYSIGCANLGDYVDFERYVRVAEQLTGTRFDQKYAFVPDSGQRNARYRSTLKRLGFTVVTKKPRRCGENWRTNFNVEITLLVRNDLDADWVFGTGDRDLTPLLSRVAGHCIVLACGIPKEFRQYSQAFEITADDAIGVST